ncbi:MAG TPA: hypothetical protein VGK22_12600 [Candidatus Angelobacter sp.]
MREEKSKLADSSLLASLEPGELKRIPITSIIRDEDNPGWNKGMSVRRETQKERISEATEMLNDVIVVPIVVCKHPTKKGSYYLEDGHGRVDHAERNGHTHIDARVLQPLDSVQRIVLREILNNSHTAFDPTVQLADVILAAKKQKLDVRDVEDAAEVLEAFPPSMAESVNKKLKVLRAWPAKIVHRVTADAVKVGGGTIAYNKLEELTPLAKILQKRHGLGDEVFDNLLSLLKGGSAFSGGRAQETIREARKIFSKLPPRNQLVAQFLEGDIDLITLEQKSRPVIAHEKHRQDKEEEQNTNKIAYRSILDSLDGLDFDALSPTEQKVLLRRLTEKRRLWSAPRVGDEEISVA